MISRNGKEGFLKAHYDWLALGVGVFALVAGVVFYLMSAGEDPDEAAASTGLSVERMKPSETGVKRVEMASLDQILRQTRSPIQMAEISEKTESFLASERRVMCKCGKAIPGDVKAFPACPFCGEKQEEEKKVVLDTDADGMPDEWEKKFGLKPADPADAAADADGDGFTNLEEFQAKTDPTDGKDHPNYLDSLKIVLPLKETYVPFCFVGANKIPAGWRCSFVLPERKDDSGYGRKGLKTTALVGEEIVDTGFVLKSFEQKEAKRAIKGGQGLMKTVDASEVVVERKSDGKRKTLIVTDKVKANAVAMDVLAILSYTRGTTKTFEVVPGGEIDLNGSKYRISDIKSVGKGAKVTVESVLSGEKRVLQALEP